jgi:hypothetical protein
VEIDDVTTQLALALNIMQMPRVKKALRAHVKVIGDKPRWRKAYAQRVHAQAL